MDHAARLKVSVQKYTLVKYKEVTLSTVGTDFDYKPKDNLLLSEDIAPRSCSTEETEFFKSKYILFKSTYFFSWS